MDGGSQRERLQPTFFSLSEQWERFTQLAQRLRRREVLVRLPEEEKVRHLRTMAVPERAISEEDLESLKRELSISFGCDRERMRESILKRDLSDKKEEII